METTLTATDYVETSLLVESETVRVQRKHPRKQDKKNHTHTHTQRSAGSGYLNPFPNDKF